jgi:hypothetical protein
MVAHMTDVPVVPLPLQPFILSKLQRDIFGLLSLSSNLIALPKTG